MLKQQMKKNWCKARGRTPRSLGSRILGETRNEDVPCTTIKSDCNGGGGLVSQPARVLTGGAMAERGRSHGVRGLGKERQSV